MHREKIRSSFLTHKVKLMSRGNKTIITFLNYRTFHLSRVAGSG